VDIDVDAVNLGMLVLRVIGGLTLAAHGLNKFRSGLGGLAGWFDSLGMRPGPVHAKMAATTESGAGILLALGLATPLAALAIVGTMAVAGYVAHRKAFFVLDDGFEFTMIIATIAVAVATVGPGQWSLDNAIGLDLDGWVGLAISAGGGILAAVLHLAAFFRPPAAGAAS